MYLQHGLDEQCQPQIPEPTTCDDGYYYSEEACMCLSDGSLHFGDHPLVCSMPLECSLPGYVDDPRGYCSCAHEDTVNAIMNGYYCNNNGGCTGTGCSGSGSVSIGIGIDTSVTVGGSSSGGSGGNGGSVIT